MDDRYPDMAGGAQVPFRPSARPKIGEWMREHILERHADTPRSINEWPTKTKFPPTWQIAEILVAVDLALEAPDRPPIRLGDKIGFERVVGGQLVRVQVRIDLDPPEIWNAYPVDGGR